MHVSTITPTTTTTTTTSHKARSIRLPQDDLAWLHSDEVADEWDMTLHRASIYHGVAKLILKYHPGDAVELHMPIRGGYNITYRLEYADGTSAALRIPVKGIVKFPEEKVKYEVATMRYVAANTTIPVPKVYHAGTAAENPIGLGPFIVMEYVNYDKTMSDALKNPWLRPDQSHTLNPNIPEKKLEFLYSQMADILLQLSTLRFPRVGSLTQDDDGTFSVSGRPLTLNMNSVLEFTGTPPELLPSKPCSSNEWYSELADMHLKQLTFQHNDAVEDEDHARDGYVARQLFRRLASDGQLAAGFDDEERAQTGPEYRLFSEDLRPSNVLVDKNLRVVAVIDWEFAYSAPAQFTHDPPWWLLLKGPDLWPGGYDEFIKEYEPRLETFLRVLEAEEKKLRAKSGIEAGAVIAEPLSSHMRRSWENKTWMINYAARNSWAFDYLFWEYLDPRFFGPENKRADHHERLDLLSKSQRGAMESFVETKMEESRERILVNWDLDDAVKHLTKFTI